MRVEPVAINSFAHCVKRGGHGMPIVKDEADRFRFIRSLYYLNDVFHDDSWTHVLAGSRSVNMRINERLFHRPKEWPEREPLVKIIAYTLMPNHVHLLFKEIQDGGISMFMKKLGQSMTNHFNDKYKNKGSIFQGSYKGRTIRDDEYLRHVAVYIMIKNVFELYPYGGLEGAIKNFDSAWKFASEYPFASTGHYITKQKSPILETDLVGEIFINPREFKSFARDAMLARRESEDREIERLLID